MRERPILFSGEMVRAILDGRKTQTRRVIKPQPALEETPYAADILHVHHNPPWHVGDRLWVRETWQNTADMNICHPADGEIVYRATDPDWETMEGWKWRPSIFMPRWASRVTLEITDIRVERVQDITYIDAKAEGVEYEKGYTDPREAFRFLWQSINAKRGYPWAENPWVWVIEFKVAEPPQEEAE